MKATLVTHGLMASASLPMLSQLFMRPPRALLEAAGRFITSYSEVFVKLEALQSLPKAKLELEAGPQHSSQNWDP